MSTLRGPAQLADLRRALCAPPTTRHVASTSLTCYCGSVPPISSILVFVAIFLLFPIEPTTIVPSRVASQWRERPSSYNGDHNSSEMAGGSPSTYHTDDTSNYVRTTLPFGAHSSSRLLVPPVGRRTRTTQTIPSEYVRTTLLFGAHSLSRILVALVHRRLVIDHSAVELPKPHPSDLFAPHSASMLQPHLHKLPAQAPRSAIDLYVFLRFGALRHARRATDKHTGMNPSNDHQRGLRLLREPIDQHTPLLSEPHRPSRDPPGLQAPFSRSSCRRSFLVVLPGKEQGVLVECLGFFVGEFFQYTRYRMGFSTHVNPS